MLVQKNDGLSHVSRLLLLIKERLQSLHLHPQIPVVDQEFVVFETLL